MFKTTALLLLFFIASCYAEEPDYQFSEWIAYREKYLDNTTVMWLKHCILSSLFFTDVNTTMTFNTTLWNWYYDIMRSKVNNDNCIFHHKYHVETCRDKQDVTSHVNHVIDKSKVMCDRHLLDNVIITTFRGQ
jgi:hypothetical protein